MEGAWQAIVQNLSFKPNNFTGVLTNGAKWSLVIKAFSDGIYVFRRIEPLCLYQDDNYLQVSESGLESVTKLILFHFRIISENMRSINDKIIPTSLKSNHQNHYDSENPEDDGENDHDGTKGMTRGFNKMSFRSTHKDQHSISNNKENQNQSGKRNQGKKTNRGLQKRNENSMLTMENLLRFNLSQVDIQSTKGSLVFYSRWFYYYFYYFNFIINYNIVL